MTGEQADTESPAERDRHRREAAAHAARLAELRKTNTPDGPAAQAREA